MAKIATQKEIAHLIAQALQYQNIGNLKAAKAVFSDVLKQDPVNTEASYRLACLYDHLGNEGMAVKLLVRAVNANASAHACHYELANILFRQKNYEDSIRHLREVIRLKPENALAHNSLGFALMHTGQQSQARASFENAIRCKPGYADPHHNLGLERIAAGDLESALDALLEATRIQPESANFYCSLGGLYCQMHRIGDAEQAAKTAVRLQPNGAKFHSNLGMIQLIVGQRDGAIQHYEEALRLNPADSASSSGLILATMYSTDDPAVLHARTEKWEQFHGVPLRNFMKRHSNSRDAARRLRIGYVSGDFWNHAAVRWIEPLLAGSKQPDFAVICYNNSVKNDAVTNRLKLYADEWIDCVALTDDPLAERIRKYSIDILVDLSSHTDANRLLVFARQPAPVQVSWFGMPVSTGLKSIQYRLTDAIIDPPVESDVYYSEKLVRLPRFYAAFSPDPAAPAVGEGPCVRNGFVTFVSLNTLAKITPAMLQIWAQLLAALPNARLLLQAQGLDVKEFADPVRQVFTQQGIAPERLSLRGWQSIGDYLQVGHEADIALDPFPFNGGVTTCHALWMGLPLVTLSGRSAASRVGSSILTGLGLTDLVAQDAAAYKSIAMNLAADSARLASLRASMRGRMETSGLLDGAGLAREVQDAYRAMWQTWCAT